MPAHHKWLHGNAELLVDCVHVESFFFFLLTVNKSQTETHKCDECFVLNLIFFSVLERTSILLQHEIRKTKCL